MTTIVYRDGILAGDTRAYSGDRSPIGQKQKIFQVVNSDGSFTTFGVSSPIVGLPERVRKWFENEKHFDFEPPIQSDESFQALEINGKGEVFYYNGSFTPSGPLMADYFAIGSGMDFAIGALEMGATAQQAVVAASKGDMFTGGVVQHIVVQAQQPVTEEITTTETLEAA